MKDARHLDSIKNRFNKKYLAPCQLHNIEQLKKIAPKTLKFHHMQKELSRSLLPILEQPNGNLNQKDIALIIYRRKWLIVILFFAIFITVAIAAFLKPTRYLANAKLLLKKERVHTIISPTTDISTAVKPQVSEQLMNTEIGILKSRTLLRKVVNAIGLARLTTSMDQEKSTELNFEYTVSTLKKDLNIKPVPSSSIIEVSYESGDSELSAAVVNMICHSYVDQHLKVYQNSGIYSFFEKQAQTLYDTLQATSDALRSFESSNGLIDPVKQRDIILRQLPDYESQLNAATIGVKEYERQIEFLEQQLTLGPAQLQERSRNVRSSRMMSLTYELDSLHVKYKELTLPGNNDSKKDFMQKTRFARSIRARIAHIEEMSMLEESQPPIKIDDDIQKTLIDISSELIKARSQLIAHQIHKSELISMINDLKQGLNEMGNAKFIYETLIRQWQLVQDNYFLYAKKKEEARISEALDQDKVANVTIIDPATIPLRPIPVNRKLTLVLGFFLAMFVSIGTAFGLNFFDNLIRTPNDIERQLNIPVILVIPEGQQLDNGYTGLPKENQHMLH